MVPAPLWGARASPVRAAGMPLTRTVALPWATAPRLEPQQASRSVVTLEMKAAGRPLVRTSGEQLAVISPVKGMGPWGGMWPVCYSAVVPSTRS